MRRRIYFDDIKALTLGHEEAVSALATRFCSIAILTIDGLGEKSRESGFASAAWAGKEIGLTNLAELERVLKSGDDVFLANNFSKLLWSILAVKSRGVGHSGVIKNNHQNGLVFLVYHTHSLFGGNKKLPRRGSFLFNLTLEDEEFVADKVPGKNEDGGR